MFEPELMLSCIALIKMLCSTSFRFGINELSTIAVSVKTN